MSKASVGVVAEVRWVEDQEVRKWPVHVTGICLRMRGRKDWNGGLRQAVICPREKGHLHVGVEAAERRVHVVMCVSEGTKRQQRHLSGTWQSRDGLTRSLTSQEGRKCRSDIFQK